MMPTESNTKDRSAKNVSLLPGGPPRLVPRYDRLEDRQLLSATFGLIGTSGLALDNFDAGQNLTFSQEPALVDLAIQDTFVFRVESGSFVGDTSNPFIELEDFGGGVNNQLEVATAFFTGGAAQSQVSLDGSTASGAVQFDQASASLNVGLLELRNFANDNQDFSLAVQGDVLLENITVFDSDPTDAISTSSSFSALIDGQTEIQGTVGNLISDFSADFTLSSSDDIALTDGAEISATGQLSVSSILGDLVQTGSGSIVAINGAEFDAAGEIRLANAPDQSIEVGGLATFDSDTILVGRDGLVAGDPVGDNVRFGQIQLSADTAVIQEDDATEFAGLGQVGQLALFTNGDITNVNNSIFLADDAQLFAAGDIVLGNEVNDFISFDNVGLQAIDVDLNVENGLTLDGRTPDSSTADNILGESIARGTQVDQTLFLVADGSVEQNEGDLNAGQIGIQATEFVHLASISTQNTALAIAAGGSSPVTAPGINAILQSLQDVENSEVNASLPQAIAFEHRGEANITTVESPTNAESIAGLTSTDGSIAVLADQAIVIRQDIAAASPTVDPQVTIRSAIGDSENPAIDFLGTQASVSGPLNFGVVNTNQAFANFFDTDSFPFENTTQILTLDPDGSAGQDVVIEFGNEGEFGFRVGIVFDALNQPDAPIEDLNLFVPNLNDATEAFPDTLFQNNTVVFAPIVSNEGGIETFTQVDSFTPAAIVAHQDDPNVFTDIIVRNDQNINLFSGSIANLDNGLNESTETILAILDTLPRAVPVLPAISEFVPIEVRPTFALPFDSPPPIEGSDNLFGRDVAPFESGDLQAVQVAIPIDGLELVQNETRIKFPDRFYPAGEGTEELELDNVGQNQTEQIIEQIERSPQAEPGYWYRVYKSYQNRDDELIFYYYKTGDAYLNFDSDDTATTLDGDAGDLFESETEPPETQGVPENLDSSETPSDQPMPTDTEFEPPDETYSSSSAVALLLGMLARKSDAKPTVDGQPTESLTGERNSSGKKFDRISRLKRKMLSTRND